MSYFDPFARGRSRTFLFVMLNAVLQVLVFVLVIHQIINNYYHEVRARHPVDYVVHHLCFFLFVLFEALAVGLLVWCAAHAAAFVVRCAFGLTCGPVIRRLQKKQTDETRPSSQWSGASTQGPLNLSRVSPRPLKDEENPQDNGGCHPPQPEGLPPRWCPAPMQPIVLWMRALWHPYEALILVLVEAILFSVCVLESRLLADMSVHFIDFDLVELMGFGAVCEIPSDAM